MVSTLPTIPKKATKGLRSFFNRRRDECNSLIEIRLATSSFPLPYPNATEPDDDDTSSISSHSTNSTVDDNPGTGRLIDKHIYQKLGRKLEHFIFRIKLPSPPPARIYGFFEKMFPYRGCIQHTPDFGLQLCVDNLMKSEHGNSSIYGLKCLVKQTQSPSLHQSAAALITLMRMTMFDWKITRFYICISRLEPIFHAETLVISNNDSSLKRNYTFLLVRLAKAHAIATKIRSRIPRMTFPHDLRQDFLCLLDALPSRPVADDLFEPVAEACHIYAQAVHYTNSDIYKELYVRETMYLMIIFFLRSIPILHDQINSVKDHKTQQFIQMVLSALSNWLDCSISMSISAADYPDYYFFKNRIALYGLVQIHHARIMLPQSFEAASVKRVISYIELPRGIRGLYECRHDHRIRSCSSCTRANPPLIQVLVDQSKSRNIRLLTSFSELEREVKDVTILRAGKTLEKGGRGIQRNFRKKLLRPDRRHSKALRALVVENELTEEFRIARKYSATLYQYKTYCLWRSKWAQFFLSNLDWDWDLAGSLEQLYALDESTPIPPAHALKPETHIATIDAEGAVGRTWDMKTRTTQQRTALPKEVRIPYASETGDIEYMVFTRNAEVPGDSTEGRTSLSDRDGDAEERGSVGTAEVDMCAGGSGSSGTQYFKGEIASVEGNDATASLETPSDSGASLDTQKCDSVSWIVQDVDGRPVIPYVEEESECEAFIEELASQSEGEGTTFGMSAKSTQDPPKGNDPTTSFAQYTSFATEAPDNQAFIEELDDEKYGDEDSTTSKISNELVRVPSNKVESASAFTGQTRFAFVGQTGMKWFQIVGVVCASILLERLIIAILGHIYGMGGNNV